MAYSKKKTISVAVVFVIVALSLGYGISAYGSFFQSPSNGSSSQYGVNQCSAVYPNGLDSLNNQDNSLIPALVMSPSTKVAKICIIYPYQDATSGQLVALQGIVSNADSTFNWLSPKQAAGFNVTASPETFNFKNISAGVYTIVYTISSVDNGKGFYYFTFTNDCSSPIPLAVGYSSSEVNQSDFYNFAHHGLPLPQANQTNVAPGCIVQTPLLQGTVIGVQSLKPIFLSTRVS